MASDIPVVSMTVHPGIEQVVITVLASPPVGMTCLPYMQPSKVQIYSATVNNFLSATLVGTVNSGAGVLVHAGIDPVTRYYWARALDVDNNLGPVYPGGAGIPATPTIAVPDQSITGPKLADGAVTPTKMSVGQLSAISANIGDITAGTVTGVTFTGGLFRTAVTGRRVETDGVANYIKVYDGAGNLVATLGELGGLNALLSISRSVAANNVSISNTNVGGTAARILGRVNLSIAGGGSGFNSVLLDVSHAHNQGNAHAGQFTNSAGGGHGLAGLSAVSGGYAFYSVSGGYGPFTGMHPALILKGDEAVPGDILVDAKVLGRNGLDNTLTEVVRASENEQAGVVGVLSSRRPYEDGALLNVPFGPIFRGFFETKYDLATINGLGEGQMNVCGRGGNLQRGDLICASCLPGKGQRQRDDIVRSWTVAKAREDVTFDHPDQVKRVAVIYLCG